MAWQGWTTAAEIAISHNIHLDTNFYSWGTWLQKPDNSWAHGYINGSGQSMKFINSTGTILNNFQQLTQLVDEQLIVGAGSGWEALDAAGGFAVSKQLIDSSQAGDYAAIMTQFHSDYYYSTAGWAESTMTYADGLGIPMWNADKWLNYVTARHDAELTQINWDSLSKSLSFNLVASGGSQQNLTLLIPATYQGSQLDSVNIDGNPATISLQTIKGKSEAFVNTTAVNHAVVAIYQGGGSSADLAVTKSDSPDPVLAGNDVTYLLTVQNLGPSNAVNVVLIDNLPTGVTYKSVTPGSWTCTTPTTSQVRCTLASLGMTSSNVTIVATVKPETRGSVTNQVSVSNSLADPSSSNNSSQAATTVNAQVDLELSKVASNTAPYMGSDVTFTLTVTNKGPSQATGVKVKDLLATGYQYKSSVPSQGSYDPGTGEWTVGSLTVNQSATLQLTGTVKVSGTYDNYAQVTAANEPDLDSTPNDNSTTQDDDDTVTVSPVPASDLRVTKTDDPDPVLAGNDVTYVVTVENLGPLSATNVVLTDTLPAGVTYKSVTPGSWTCPTPTTSQVRCTLASLGMTSSNVTIVATVKPETRGSVTNQVSVSNNIVDAVPSNNSSQAATTVNAQVDLELSKVASSTTPNVGEDVLFTLTVTNKGPSQATGVKVKDLLATGYQYKSSVPSQGSYNAGTGDWTVGTLAVNQSATLQLTGTVKISGTYDNYAQVTAANETDLDSTPNDNSTTQDDDASVTVKPILVANLSLVKTVSNSTPYAGAEVLFNLTIHNAGPSNATGVTVKDILPSNAYTFSNAVPSQGSYDPITGIWDVGTVSVGVDQSLQLSVIVKIEGAATNIAEIWTSDAQDTNSTPGNGIVTEDDYSTRTTNALPAADLKIVKSGGSTAIAGQQVNYTLDVTNLGPSVALNVLVTDTLPAGMSIVSVSSIEWTCSNTSKTVTCSKISVSKGTTPSILVTANVDTGTFGNVVNHSRVSSVTTDIFPANNTSNVTTDVSWRADLSLSKTGNATAIAGQQATYTLSVANNGPSNSTGVVVTDTLPAGMSYSSNNLGWSCALAPGNKVRCLGGDLAFGATKRLDLVVAINPNIRGILTNQAAAASSNQDLVPGNNSASAQTSIQGAADLSLAKIASKTNPEIYSTVSFTVTVTNHGPSQATGVEVVNSLPAGYTAIVADTTQGSYANGSWNVGTLDLNGSAVLVMSAKVLPHGPFNNTAQVSSVNESDPVPGNNTVTVSMSPILADLSLTQTVSTDKPRVDSELVITLKIKNEGPNSAGSIQVRDVLPAGLTFVSSASAYNPTTGTWAVGILQSGQEAFLSITARVDLVGTIKNIAQVSVSDQYDPDSIPGNDAPAEDDYASVDIQATYKVYLPAIFRSNP